MFGYIVIFIIICLFVVAGLVLRWVYWYGPETTRKTISAINWIPGLGFLILLLTGTRLTVWNVVGTLLISLVVAGIVAIFVRHNDMGD